jgi:hypothetical protein
MTGCQIEMKYKIDRHAPFFKAYFDSKLPRRAGSDFKFRRA